MVAVSATMPLLKAPAWAVLERKLFEVMEQSVYPFLEKYTHEDGRLIWREGVHQTAMAPMTSTRASTTGPCSTCWVGETLCWS